MATSFDPGKPVMLKAGALTAELHGADLRHVRVGDVEIAERIYLAVRDPVWNTVRGEWLSRDIEVSDPDRFLVTVRMRHRTNTLDFEWTGRIEGVAAGEVRFDVSATAVADSTFANLGLNVHHPMATFANRAFHVLGPGMDLDGVLPLDIQPQRFDIEGWALFPPLRSISVELPTMTVEMSIEGDLFEVQDHRNWTDANYKAYTTPLAIPRPLVAVAGSQLWQEVVLRGVSRVGGLRPYQPASTIRIELGADLGPQLPRIGTMAPSHDRAISAVEAELLAALRLDHLRVDARVVDPDWVVELRRQVAVANKLGLDIELAVTADELTPSDVETISAVIGDGAPVTRIGLFGATRNHLTGSTPPELLVVGRQLLGIAFPNVPIAGGSDHSFAEYNRIRPDMTLVDGLSIAICPTIHADDDGAIVENLRAQAVVVRSAASRGDGLPIHISPVTFRTRRGPYADVDLDPAIPIRFDPRQGRALGAGWTLGSIKYLAEAGVASATYFEATGFGGLVNDGPADARWTNDGIPAATAHPLYQVLVDVSEMRLWHVIEATSTDPLRVEVLALRDKGRLRLLLANLTASEQSVSLPDRDGPDRLVPLAPFAYAVIEADAPD